jgi:SAM-dependent methyltransferase
LTSLPVRQRCVIDVGCGNQPFRPLVESLDADYHSLDITQNAAGTVDYVTPLDGPELRDDLSGRNFAVVLCTEVLEHVFDWPRAFDNLRRLTKPGGVVILTCPFFWPLHEEPHDFWRPTPHALRRIAGEAGFVVEYDLPAGNLWDVFGTALGNARITIPALGRFGALFSTITWAIRKGVLAVLKTGCLQRFVRIDSLQGPFYLSNLMVLRRPAHGGPG